MAKNPYGPSDGTSQPGKNPYGGTSGTPKKIAAPKLPTTTAATTSKPKAPEELPPILGLGQGILKGFLTPWAGSLGALDSVLKGVQTNKFEQNIWQAGAKNIAALWGSKDLFGADGWEGIKTGETIATERLGLENKKFELPAAFAQNIPIVGGIARAKVAAGQADAPVSLGSASFWAGLGLDIALDPLSVPGVGKGLSQVVKGAAKAGQAGVKASKLATSGEISAALAARKAGEKVAPTNIYTGADAYGLSGKLKTPARIEKIKGVVTQSGGAAAKELEKLETAAGKYVYKTVQIDGPRGFGQAAKDVIASAAEASAKSIAATAVSARSINFLEQYAKRDVTTFGRKLKTSIVKDADTGTYRVLSGNKVLLGEAASEFEAKKLAESLRKGLDVAAGLAPASTLQGARRIEATAEGAEESIVVPAKDGTEVTLEKYVPHASDDGTFAVYDGDNVAVFNSEADANEWIDVYTSPAKQNVEPVVTGKSGKWQVNVGSSVTKFTSKKQADAYAQALRTGEVSTGRRVTTGGSPIIDSAPIDVKVADALKVPTKKEASALKSVLKGIDEIAKKTSGWRGEVSIDLVNLVKRTLSTQQAALDKFLLKVDKNVLRDLKAFTDNEISFAELESALSKSNNADRQAMWNLINKIPVYTSKGTKKLEELLKEAKGNFLKITEVGEGVSGSTLENQVMQFIDTQIAKRGANLQNNKVKPAFDAEGKYEALVASIGEANAKKVKATGYLDQVTDATRKKFDKVLDEFSVQNSEVSYAGYDDLVKGLERGDDVSDSALQEIFKLLDPDGAIISKVEQAAAEPASAFLRRAFTREGGVDSIREAEKRLAMMRDPEMLAKHAGLAYEAEVADMIKVFMSDNKSAIQDLATQQTQQKSAEAFSSYKPSVQTDAAESLGRALFGDAKKGGAGGQLDFRREILSSENAREGLTTLDDYAVMSGEAYSDGSRAMLSRQIQQSTETKIIASILAKDTYRLNQAAKAAKEKGTELVPKTPVERLDSLNQKMLAVNDLATAQTWRFSRTKNRNDKTFQEAYAAEMAKAKKTNTTPNFSALKAKHTVYLPMGDILSVMRTNGGEAGLLKGFFPDTTNTKVLKRDSMSWISLGDAARRVLEMDAAREPFDLEEIARRLLVRGEGQETISAARQKEVAEAAKEMADILTSPQVVAELKGVHLDNAASIVKDFGQKAETFSEELFDALDGAFVAMHASNDLSDVARADAVRTFFRKFVIASDIMRIEGGPIAEAMFRATAMMFADGGKILPTGKIAKGLDGKSAEYWNLLRTEEYRLFREALTKMYRYENKPAAPIGREGMKTPKPAAQAKAETKLSEAEAAYEAHINELQVIETQNIAEDLTTIKAWEAKQARLQSRLDKARADAWNNWVPTRHWSPDGWVPTENFDAAKASREAQQVHTAYVAGRRGLEDRALYLADSEPTIPPHRKMTAKEKAKFLEKFNKDTTNFQVDNAKAIVDDVTRNVEDEVMAGRLDIEELAPNEQMMRAAQEVHARGIKEATEIKVRRVIADYSTPLPKTNREFNQLFRPGLNPDTPVYKSDRQAARIKRAAERWSGPTGRRDVVQLLKHAENSTVTESSNFAEALDKISRKYANRPPEEMEQVWTIIRDGGQLPDDASGFLKAMYTDMEMFTSQIFKGHARSVLSQHGINGSVLSDMFERFGLKEDYGFIKPTELIGKTPDELTQSMFSYLPFGSVPSKLKGTQEAIEWQQRATKFKEAGMTPLLAFTRMMESVQMVKMEKGIAENAVAQFGWKTHFKTLQEAIDDGWVGIEAVGKQNIARFMPDAENGGLFPPFIADQLGSVFREYNNMYEGKQLAPFLRKAMKVMGVIKFTQTTLMPRHHVTNAFGDSTTAMIAGVRDPRDWGDGFDLANIFTAKNFEADWAKFGKDFEAKGYRMAAAFAEEPGKKTGMVGMTSEEFSFTFYKDGKPVTEKFNKEAFADDLATRGGLVPGFVQADLQGFTGELALNGATQVQKEAFQNMFSKFVARPGRATMKGFSDFTAAYSNGIRGAHALKVARSQTWNSYDEMMNAVMDALNKYHPTVQSLASTERKWGRLAFTYYTWIRVAHSALLDMAINHTGSMLAIPKGMYNYALMEGFNPANPAEPFESKNALPDYVSYSVYGPNAMDEQGPRTYRPPFLPLDVLDFWQVYVDPSKPLDENLIKTGQQTARMVGKSTNILGAPIIAGLFGVDPGTGAPVNIKNSEAFVDEALSNFGFMSALTGMGLYTPFKYRNPDTTNPLTDADRRRLLENTFTGMRAVDIQRPVNIKKAESQYGSRVKQYNERINAENLEKVQGFVDDKVAEGYSKDEIIQMLRDMGVK